jgi:hypothetical protein
MLTDGRQKVFSCRQKTYRIQAVSRQTTSKLQKMADKSSANCNMILSLIENGNHRIICCPNLNIFLSFPPQSLKIAIKIEKKKKTEGN